MRIDMEYYSNIDNNKKCYYCHTTDKLFFVRVTHKNEESGFIICRECAKKFGETFSQIADYSFFDDIIEKEIDYSKIRCYECPCCEQIETYGGVIKYYICNKGKTPSRIINLNGVCQNERKKNNAKKS